MGYKIGEIFRHNGEWYQCIRATCGCDGCAFQPDLPCNLIDKCLPERRSDCISVIFKKLEKVGEPYEDNGLTIQRYRIYYDPIIAKSDIIKKYVPGLIDIELKQNKDMENGKLDPRIEKVIDEATQKLGNEISRQLNENLNKKEMEEKKLNLKPFDLEEAKRGKPVCTRDGRKARIICFDRILSRDGNIYPIVALVENKNNEFLYAYTEDGLLAKYKENDADLMMLPEKKEGWINVYKGDLYDTLESAKENCAKDNGYIKTIKVKWEE